MRAISGREINVPKNVRVLHVEQEAHGDDTKVFIYLFVRVFF